MPLIGTLNLHTSDVDFKDPLDPPSELEHVNQTWDVGYNVSASQAGKGLATASLRTLIDDWVKPYMKLRRMGAVSLLADRVPKGVTPGLI